MRTKTWLSKEEEDTVKEELLIFVKRASSSSASEREVAVLPEIVKILLNNMTEYPKEQIGVDTEKIRTLLKVLIQAEYEFNTSNNLCVTDRPDLVPCEIKFETNFTGISGLISEQIFELEKLVGNNN